MFTLQLHGKCWKTKCDSWHLACSLTMIRLDKNDYSISPTCGFVHFSHFLRCKMTRHKPLSETNMKSYLGQETTQTDRWTSIDKNLDFAVFASGFWSGLKWPCFVTSNHRCSYKSCMSQGDGNTAVKTKARIKRETKEIRAKENQRGSKVSHLTVEVLFILSNQCQRNQVDYYTVFESHRKSLIQHCERSEWSKVKSKCQKWPN